MNVTCGWRFLWIAALGFSLLVGCAGKNVASGAPARAPAPTVAAAPEQPTGDGSVASSGEEKRVGHAHSPADPPIDCPLRDQGVDPAHLRPFEDVEEYIAFLERPDRAVWQKPDDVVAALGLTGTETVVDLGAGSGYFSFRLAEALPRGQVVAADTEPEMIRHIHHRAMAEGVENLHALLIQPQDPEIPADADLVFVCDVLHHVADRSAWLGKLVAEMSPGARLVLIEFKEGELPEGPPESVKIPRAQLMDLVSKAGLVLTAEREGLLPYQMFLVFRKS